MTSEETIVLSDVTHSSFEIVDSLNGVLEAPVIHISPYVISEESKSRNLANR